MSTRIKKTIQTWIADKKIRLNNNIDNPVATVATENTDAIRQHKQKFSQLQACSTARHAADCDIISCTKNPCFVWEPDRIVSKEYKIELKNPKHVGMGKYGK